MERITVQVNKPYDIVIGKQLIDNAIKYLSQFIQKRKVLIITEDNVNKHGYLDKLKYSLENHCENIEFLSLPPGEAQKNLRNVELIIRHLADTHFTRDDVLIALGGGVIGDLVGFTASIYLRGIAYIQVPTTFLSAIDSSVGGKTAVDITQGKNLVGAFHHPVCVLCDTSTFQSLPADIFEDGCSELIKYAMIMNPKLLKELIEREQPLNKESSDLPEIIYECVKMKRDIVLKDEFDHGLRQLLNFGHTLGHALEQGSQYRISHGRGVAMGMAVFTKMAVTQQLIHKDIYTSLIQLLNEYHLLSEIPPYTSDQLINIMLNDKKRRMHQMTIVFPNEFGQCRLHVIDLNTFQQNFEKEWEQYEVHQRY
ncbi:3-dehydroquinate synthase [Ruoffia sp. FAM 20857]|uniref:3-dehydroquinate synthase n=1 Tax=unclassified Ruoffia TaxID=2862149 RepID=UPI00388540EA